MQVWGQRAIGLVDGKAVTGTKFWDWERGQWVEVIGFAAPFTSEFLRHGPSEVNGMADRRPASERYIGS